MARSIGFIPAASTLMSTCPGPAFGFGTSETRGWPPYSLTVTARIATSCGVDSPTSLTGRLLRDRKFVPPSPEDHGCAHEEHRRRNGRRVDDERRRAKRLRLQSLPGAPPSSYTYPIAHPLPRSLPPTLP